MSDTSTHTNFLSKLLKNKADAKADTLKPTGPIIIYGSRPLIQIV